MHASHCASGMSRQLVVPTHSSFHPTFEPECALLLQMLSLHRRGAEKRQLCVFDCIILQRAGSCEILLIVHDSPLNGQHRGLCNSQVPHCMNTLQWQDAATLSHHFSVAPDKGPEAPV